MATTALAPPRAAHDAIRPTAPDPVRITFAVLIILCLSTAPFVSLTRWITDQPLALETWPYVYTMWGAALLGAGLFVLDVVAPIVARGMASSEAVIVALAAPVALALWALMSAFWSTSPGRTPLQAILMSLVILTAIWFGYALTFRQQVVSLFVGLHLLVLPSFVLALALESARFESDDSWIGLFQNPNSLSPVATLAIVASLGALLLTTEVWMRLAIAACVVVDVVVALKASSATGWVALCGAIATLAVVLFARGLATRGVAIEKVRVVLVTLVGLAIVSIPFGFGLVADAFEKDSTLTGRRDIWDFVLDSVEDRWIYGFGWFSFWDDPANRLELFERTGRELDAAHSTFFETLLYLGAIGLLLLLVVVVFGVGRTWWEALSGKSWAMAWWAAVGMFALLENVTESMIAYNSIFWVLLVAPGFAALRYSEAAPASRTVSLPEVSTDQRAAYTYQ